LDGVSCSERYFGTIPEIQKKKLEKFSKIWVKFEFPTFGFRDFRAVPLLLMICDEWSN